MLLHPNTIEPLSRALADGGRRRRRGREREGGTSPESVCELQELHSHALGGEKKRKS